VRFCMKIVFVYSIIIKDKCDNYSNRFGIFCETILDLSYIA
jgi:hypothetical protein